MLKKCTYYVKEDNFFPVSMNNPLCFLIRKVTWSFLNLKRTPCKQDKGWINRCRVAFADASHSRKLSKRKYEIFQQRHTLLKTICIKNYISSGF